MALRLVLVLAYAAAVRANELDAELLVGTRYADDGVRQVPYARPLLGLPAALPVLTEPAQVWTDPYRARATSSLIGPYEMTASAPGQKRTATAVPGAMVTTHRKTPSRTKGGLLDCAWCPELVEIPAGGFRMGDLAGTAGLFDRPVRQVSVHRFALARHETTVAQFRHFATATSYRTEAERRDGGKGCRTLEYATRNKWGWTPGRSWRDLEFAIEDDQPVVCVSWDDAQAYIGWLNQLTGGGWRLPSEAEWEYTARAGSETRYHFGDDASRLCEYGNLADRTVADRIQLPNKGNWEFTAECADGAAYPTSVGRYLPNAFGLQDMLGNVWEWTADCWNDSYVGAPKDGQAWERGDCTVRVLRGGSWRSHPWDLQSAARNVQPTGNRDAYTGFRVARTLAP